MNTGVGSPLLSNDEVVIDKMIEFGYDQEDAINYVVSACWEPSAVGKGLEQNNINFTTKPTLQPPIVQSGADKEGMLNFVNIRDYGSYCAEMSIYKEKLPENFIFYDALSTFGEFHNFYVLKGYLDRGEIPEYSYSLKSESGEIFKITITEPSVATLGGGAGSQLTQLRDNDLRYIDAKELDGKTKHIRIGDVIYVYQKNGCLNYIQWEQDNLTITLRSIPVTPDVTPWTVEGLSPVFRDLLYIDTAEQAMETFKASMESAAVK